MASVPDYVDSLQTQGRYTFSREEAIAALTCSPDAFRVAINRLARRNRVLRLRRGFFIIVPLEYANTGVLPGDWLIDDLMHYLGLPYYVGLLTAAAHHGAGHHRPQEYQVVTTRPVRPIAVGRLRIRLFTKSALAVAPTVEAKSPTGFIRVSTPEVTALDLLRYSAAIGGLGHAMTVMQELGETMESGALSAACSSHSRLADVQRLGWLIECCGFAELARTLTGYLDGLRKAPAMIPLDASRPRRGAQRNRRWRLLINTDVEADL